MNILRYFIACSLFFCSFSLLAYHCPMDIKKIDHVLASNPPLSQTQQVEVRNLRALGEQYHRSGDHDRAVQLLCQAMQILRIQ
ncbi:MAG: tetratricopeptide repeat protein [Candidatus Thiodiazotropha sp. (ex Lucinoma borealis)]|nr:tetratricopeptide repeat protein [Candidatus Thiodiazotropha sp. (ex Lucinoma borealis)]MCU7854304.1 tetratricopeptide repeat protein [Candidatus Thiodiazotropha sp. (ex Lucinoma borealis)]MCU7866103.1 tetratricopeptide repeat protein [Candidatus Thiodiazotropha sp. (ex Lucinoma borealis)]MCU7868567.1 tetratricopeptide repeat protein [Candidatus Thiodiazotropha sp. (ex Lucinoma borealis)]